jgi:Domain of unknown function (DUF4062)
MTNHNPTAPRLYPGVMVSSTFTDLKDHRAAIIKAIESQQLKSVGMDDDPAKPSVDVITSSLEMVNRSSAYVLIIGHRYGQVIEDGARNPERLSVTELEFDEAIRLGRPVILFLMGEEHDLKRRDVEKDSDSIGKLATFREKAINMGARSSAPIVYKVFNSLEQFEVEANRSIAELRRLLDKESAVEPANPAQATPRALVQITRGNGDLNMVPSSGSYPIRGRTPQDLVEFRFTELLKPVLDELRELLHARSVAITFLPERNGSIVPILNDQDYHDYDKIKVSLLEENNRFRKLKVASAVVSDWQGRVSFYNNRASQTLRELNAILQDTDFARWNEWVSDPIAEQVGRWASEPDSQIVCSLKYIASPENRDVIGHLVVQRQHRIHGNEVLDEKIGEKARRLIEGRVLLILRHFVLELAESKVQETTSRSSILNTILEAAVSLSGADWGCIKSSTLGAASSNMHANDCELVKAVCVHNCPRFFHEGSLVETEELVKYAILANEDMVLNLSDETRKSYQHPASQMAVFLIRDPERVIEPQLSDSDVVGAIVVQHTEQNYLSQSMSLYAPYLQELTNLTARATRSAASKSLVSILKRKVAGEKTESLEAKIVKVVNWISIGKNFTWALLRPANKTMQVMYKSRNELGGLQEALFEMIGAGEPLKDQSRLAAFVCNSTMSFMLDKFNHRTRPIQLRRVAINEYGAFAYFNDEYKEIEESLKQRNENRVMFNLGKQYVWEKAILGNERLVSFVISPIVSPTGSPLAVLAVLREVNKWESAPWRPDKLEEFEKRLNTLRDDLYLSHLELTMAVAGPADA